jgi:hypothetical protein
MFLPLENTDTEEATFYMLTHFSMGNIVQDTASTNSDGILPGTLVFLQFSSRGLFYIKGVFLPLENAER